jgi:hypothetical protein
MMRANLELVNHIRRAANKLAQSETYQWGHMGSCNCGFLAQEITKLTKAEIHQRAMARRGDWHDQLNDYCPTSGLPIDDAISEMLNAGLDTQDLQHLERLSDPKVLALLPKEQRYLKHNLRDDVVLYMKTWANWMEEALLEKIELRIPKDSPVVV